MHFAVAAAAAGVLLVIAFLVYGHVLALRPLSGDNLYILGWTDSNPASALLRGDPDFYPEWRPLAYLTIWLQYRWAGLDHVSSYHLVNLLLWTLVAWLVFLLVVRVTHSAVGGLLSAWIVLADPRPVFAVIWIDERMSSLACVFGLLALLMVVRRTTPLTAVGWVVTAVLLLASALSKEFGLAFAGVVTAWFVSERRYDVAAAGVVAAVAYFALRWGFAHGAPGPLCDEMGYFFSLRNFCFSQLDTATVAQGAYNVAAAVVGSVMSGVLAAAGQIRMAPSLLLIGLPLLILAIVGWVKKRTTANIAMLLIGFTAILNFSSYRERNLTIALCGFAVAAGIGLVAVDRLLRERPTAIVARAVAASILVGLMAVQTVRTRSVVVSAVESLLRDDPCEELVNYRHLEQSFVSRVKIQYEMDNPGCVGP